MCLFKSLRCHFCIWFHCSAVCLLTVPYLYPSFYTLFSDPFYAPQWTKFVQSLFILIQTASWYPLHPLQDFYILYLLVVLLHENRLSSNFPIPTKMLHSNLYHLPAVGPYPFFCYTFTCQCLLNVIPASSTYHGSLFQIPILCGRRYLSDSYYSFPLSPLCLLGLDFSLKCILGLSITHFNFFFRDTIKFWVKEDFQNSLWLSRQSSSAGKLKRKSRELEEPVC